MRFLIAALPFALVLGAALPLLSNCTSDATKTSQQPAVTDSSQQSAAADSATATSTATSTAASTATALASANSSATDYQLAPRDIVEVAVFQAPDLNKVVQVSEDGNITLPLLGKVPLVGKTTHQAEEILADRLRKKYLQSPQVSVMIKQYGQKITVSGEVKGPRVLAVDGRVTLSQAIAGSGGLTELANTKRVHVARATGPKIDDTVYNYDAIQAGQEPDPVLQGGDLVVAEQSGTQVALKNIKDMLPFAVLASIL